MTWHLEVDGGACIASGMCAALTPEYFQLVDDRSRPLAGDVEPVEVLLDAADSCPAQAITVTDTGKVLGPPP